MIDQSQVGKDEAIERLIKTPDTGILVAGVSEYAAGSEDELFLSRMDDADSLDRMYGIGNDNEGLILVDVVNSNDQDVIKCEHHYHTGRSLLLLDFDFNGVLIGQMQLTKTNPFDFIMPGSVVSETNGCQHPGLFEGVSYAPKHLFRPEH